MGQGQGRIQGCGLGGLNPPPETFVQLVITKQK